MATQTEVGEKALKFSENLEGNGILQNLRDQRNAGKFCDIVLHVEGKKLPAHRSVLAASSPYFESILKNHRVQKEDFSVGWHDVKSFEILLDYMYSGDVHIDADSAYNLLKLSNHFLVTKLKSYCEAYLNNYLDGETCVRTKDWAERYNMPNLLKTATDYIYANIAEIMEKPALSELSSKKLELFITDPSTGCEHVPLQSLLNAIALWAKRDISKRSQGFQKLLDVINWKDNDPQEIFAHIESETLYQESKLSFFLILRTLITNDVEVGKYAEDYEELRVEFQESGILAQLTTEPEVISGDAEDDGILDDDDDVAQILVEPLDEAAATSTKRGGRGKPKANPVKPEPISTPRKRTRIEPIDVDDDIVDANTPRTRRRVKPKFSSQEWETFEQPAKSARRSVAEARTKKIQEPQALDEMEDHVQFGEDSQQLDSTVDETLDHDMTNEDLNDDDNINEDENGEAINQSSGGRIKPGYASLAQWREGVKCPNCSYVGHSATRLEQHMAKVHEEDQTYKCKMCSFQCKWNREYYKHMKEHYGGPPYRCEDCDYTCDRIQFILSHRMRHTDERPFSCELCSFSSRTKGNLIVHTRIHTGEKPYRCQHCGRCFAMKNTLDQHLATHRDDRPFLCDTCGFTTKYQSHLLSHKRIHTGNVFNCEQPGCSYYSPRRSQLAAHMRSHMSIRSHICSTCGRGFIEKSHLIRHERIHLDEKPFKCDACDYGSTRRDKLKEHVLKHHSSEGAPKTPYKPRKPRSSRSTAQMNTLSSDEVAQSQIIIGSESPQEIQISQAQMSEQDLATHNLIYEYSTSGDQITINPARVVIQPMGEFGDAQTIVVEQKEDGEDGAGDEEEGEAHQVVVYEGEGSEDGQQAAEATPVWT